MLGKHRGGDRPHTAGNWGNRGGFWCNCFKIHISTEFPIAANVDANGDNDAALGDEISRDHGSLARSRNEDLRIPAGFLKISGLCMADGDSRILLEQQHRKGFADDHASAYHRHALSIQVNAVVSQDFHDSLGCAGSKTTFISREYLCNIDRAHTVDILLRINDVPDLS